MEFPPNWTRETPTNDHVTHCFKNENDRILMTVTDFHANERSFYINYASVVMHLHLNREKKNMVEDDVTVREVVNNNGVGYYFMATGKNWTPQSNEWPYMLRCCYVTMNQFIEITVLCHDQHTETISQAFDFLWKIWSRQFTYKYESHLYIFLFLLLIIYLIIEYR